MNKTLSCQSDYELLLPSFNPVKICGVDEAGRGPLAGPVFAAAVVLPPDFPFEILDDSKKLSARKREEAEKIIKTRATAYAIAFSTHQEIDEINILQATLLAMKRAILKIETSLFETVLIDGNKVPSLPFEDKIIMPVVKGDALVHQIMAASILAKTARDRFMLSCDKTWPEYGYAKHMGYGTHAHIQALLKYGPSPIQRKTFHY